MQKIALITGITGQDGSYLAALLLAQGYSVHGTSRTLGTPPWRHEVLGIHGAITLHSVDLTNYNTVAALLHSVKPTELYHLAAASSVAESIQDPYATFTANYSTTLTLLEAIRKGDMSIRFFHASSSEIFDQSATQPLSLTSPKAPRSPYGLSKLAAHTLVELYRTQYAVFAVNGVLFPHESPLRQPYSLIKKVIHHAHTREPLTIASMDTERDFGDAAEYATAIWLTLQQENPTDYLIASGQRYRLRDIIAYIYDSLDASTDLIHTQEHPTISYPSQIYGDISVTTAQLGWKPERTVFAVIDDMIAFALQQKHDSTL